VDAVGDLGCLGARPQRVGQFRRALSRKAARGKSGFEKLRQFFAKGIGIGRRAVEFQLQAHARARLEPCLPAAMGSQLVMPGADRNCERRKLTRFVGLRARGIADLIAERRIGNSAPGQLQPRDQIAVLQI
jgi:hypothetical protein